MAQTTVISFFKYSGFGSKWQALSRMGRPPLKGYNVKGLTFWKPLGSGSGNGFSIWPDFSVYGLLTVFDSEGDAYNFLSDQVVSAYIEPSKAYSHILMHNIKAHGVWSQQQPFNSSTAFDDSKPLAVITRATIKPKLAYKFWKNVPSVSKSMDNYDGLLFSKGIGEWPILMQATFSLWNTGGQMMEYAYNNKKHAAMIKKTRELNWYSEELFSRFHPFDSKGNFIKTLKF